MGYGKKGKSTGETRECLTGCQGIEPGTPRTRSEDYTTKPVSHNRTMVGNIGYIQFVFTHSKQLPTEIMRRSFELFYVSAVVLVGGISITAAGQYLLHLYRKRKDTLNKDMICSDKGTC